MEAGIIKSIRRHQMKFDGRCKESRVSKTEEKTPEVAEEIVVDEQGESDNATAADLQDHPQVARSNAWVGIALGVIVTFAVGTGGWFGWHELQAISRTTQSLDASFQALNAKITQLKALEATTRRLDDQVQRLEKDVARADTRNQSVIDRVEIVAEQLAKAQVDTRSSYVLAEAEYLLKLADQRLLVERNPETAVTLMRTAQALLGQLQDGRLLSVRERLAQDLQSLSAIQSVDVLGIQAELLALDPVLDDLQLPVRRLAPNQESEPAVNLQKWLGGLSEFIRIREVHAPITPLVSASDAGRAREVLRLSLEQIKVALIREDQALFDAGLAQAKRLSMHFFDVTESAGRKVVTVLSLLEGTQIIREIPDAAQGLRALKAYRDALTLERVSGAEVRQ
jgi:uroporphyrin-3 C-methyltransferase